MPSILSPWRATLWAHRQAEYGRAARVRLIALLIFPTQSGISRKKFFSCCSATIRQAHCGKIGGGLAMTRTVRGLQATRKPLARMSDTGKNPRNVGRERRCNEPWEARAECAVGAFLLLKFLLVENFSTPNFCPKTSKIFSQIWEHSRRWARTVAQKSVKMPPFFSERGQILS